MDAPRFSWRLAVALPTTYALVSLLRLTLHEMGHAVVAIMLGGQFAGWYLAPGVVGYCWWREVPPEIQRWGQPLITAGGTIATTVLGSVLFLAAVLVRQRWSGWAAFTLALAGVFFLSYDLLYLAAGPLIRWGDGLALLRAGVPAPVLYGLGLLGGLFLVLVGLPFVLRAMAPFLPVRTIPQVGAALVALILPLFLYGVLKTGLLYPELRTTSLAQFGAVLAGLPALAVPVWLVRGRPAAAAQRILPAWVPAGLALLWVAVEILCVSYFGLVVAPR
jgi:hypothetical protein